MKQSQRKFAAFDIDGTVFRSGLYREVMKDLIRRGIIPEEVAKESTERYIEWQSRAHENAFEEFDIVLIKYIDENLKSLKISDYEESVEHVFSKKADNVYVYTRELINRLKEQGYFLIAISGSQLELVEPFARRYGFDTWVGQTWERGEEYFTGHITKTHTGKNKFLQHIIDEYDLTLEGSWAVGDTNGDFAMLKMVENPIAFCPTHELFEKAMAAGWKIVVERKNVIYELEKGDGTYVLAKTN